MLRLTQLRQFLFPFWSVMTVFRGRLKFVVCEYGGGFSFLPDVPDKVLRINPHFIEML